MREALGVDIGGVIIDRVNDRTDTSFFGDNYLRTTAVPGAFEALRTIVERFGHNVYLVSKCGEKVELRTLRWLAHHRFHEYTGVPTRNVRFCRERSDKAGICEKLGITHFVDDRLEVLSYLASVRYRYLFQPRTEEVARHREHMRHVIQVDSWHQLRGRLLPEK